MASSSSSLLLFLSLLLLLPYITSSNIITIPISHLPKNPHPDPYQHLSYLANSSLKRAHQLKNPQTTPPHTNIKTPLFSNSYGGYSIPLSFGSPPQTLPFMMDTGSDLTWFPCGKNYQCINCTGCDILELEEHEKKNTRIRLLAHEKVKKAFQCSELYSFNQIVYEEENNKRMDVEENDFGEKVGKEVAGYIQKLGSVSQVLVSRASWEAGHTEGHREEGTVGRSPEEGLHRFSAQPNIPSTTPPSLPSNSSTAEKSFAFPWAGLKLVIKHRQRDLGDVGGWILGKGGDVYACGEGRRRRDLGQWRER
ncbi:hypothetical protein ACE6H2_020151 [Prunus campanulata]